MKKCKICQNDTYELDVLNVVNIDFALKKEKNKIGYSFFMGNSGKNKGIIQGEIKSAYYCEKCKKIYASIDEI